MSMQEGNIFLKLTGVTGTSTETGFVKQITVLSYNFGVYGSGSKFSSGNASSTPLMLTIEGGPVAGTLRQLLQNRKLLDDGILTETQVDGNAGNKAVLTYTFKKVKVTGVTGGGAQGMAAAPAQVTLECTGIKEQHKNIGEDGMALPTTNVDWDIIKGTSK